MKIIGHHPATKKVDEIEAPIIVPEEVQKE